MTERERRPFNESQLKWVNRLVRQSGWEFDGEYTLKAVIQDQPVDIELYFDGGGREVFILCKAKSAQEWEHRFNLKDTQAFSRPYGILYYATQAAKAYAARQKANQRHSELVDFAEDIGLPLDDGRSTVILWKPGVDPNQLTASGNAIYSASQHSTLYVSHDNDGWSLRTGSFSAIEVSRAVAKAAMLAAKEEQTPSYRHEERLVCVHCAEVIQYDAKTGRPFRSRPGWVGELSYAKLQPGDAAYGRVQAMREADQWACDARDHNSDDGCPNPECFKYEGKG